MQWKARQFLKFRLAKDFCIRILATLSTAGVAQLVEHHVANVIVDGSNPFTRSILRFQVKREAKDVPPKPLAKADSHFV